MVRCPRCSHQNLPNFPACSACGTPLVPGAEPGGGDDYARLVASRHAAASRQKKVYAVVAIAALAVGGFVWYRDYSQKARRQEQLNFFERWADLEKRETGSFFNCVMASEVNMDQLSTAQQVQARIESAYFTQQKTFSDHLLTECVPKIERARQAFGSLRDAPSEMAAPLEQYKGTLASLQTGIEEYADNIKNRKQTRSVDELIQEHGNAWHSATSPTPEGVAFEKFMHCAVPGLAKMKDAQAMLEHLADTCYKKDPVVFMERVRKECGALLTDVDPKGSPSKTWKLSQQKFYEQEARQLQAWESCAKRSRKGKKVEDLATFLTGVGRYMEARTGVVKAAREIRGQ